MQSGKISYQDNILHFARYGNGPALLLAFHDKEQDQSFIKPLAAQLGGRYTIISFDLPGHGQSQWKSPMDKTALVTITERFKLEFNAEKLDILACGSGGRFALTLAEQRCEWINALWLFDPEGLYHLPWYSAHTRSVPGKGLYRFFAANPKRAISILNTLCSIKLVKKDNVAYMQEELTQTQKNAATEQLWAFTRGIIPEPDKVRWQLKKHGVQVQLHISAVPQKRALTFAKKLDAVQVHPDSSQQQLFEAFIQKA